MSSRAGDETDSDRRPFAKMAGGGNDFVMIDARQEPVENPGQLALLLCTRRLSVGADGLILIEDSSEGDFRMTYYNADGSRADFCANGTRCAARFALLEGIVQRPTMTIETEAGLLPASVEGDVVSLSVPSPREFHSRPLQISGATLDGSSLLVGVPHYVVFVDDLWAMDVVTPGRAVRHHQDLQPAGANVNFVQVRSPHRIEVRTYERGVEDETLSCGSGVVASVTTAALLGKVLSPVEVLTRSGIVLQASFEIAPTEGELLKAVTLTGDARLIYRSALTMETASGFDPEWVRNPTSG